MSDLACRSLLSIEMTPPLLGLENRLYVATFIIPVIPKGIPRWPGRRKQVVMRLEMFEKSPVHYMKATI
jgi:hypothetical protein